MAQNVLQYDILISCPEDIVEERKIVDEAIMRFNDLYGDTLGISLRSKHWSKNSFPESGNKPQALLNKQFVRDCDAAVAIMWGRFGTPTDEYGSGTEEEIELMLSQGKQVFMYFSDTPIPPSRIDSNQYKRVTAFREKYKDRGIYFVYSSAEEFRKLFFAHISQYFLAKKKVPKIEEKERPQLRLVGIDDNKKLSDKGIISNFSSRIPCTSKHIEDEITRRVLAVNDIHLSSSNPSDTFLALREKVTIGNETVQKIRQYAQDKSIQLSEDFFNCGNLSRDTFSYSIDGSRQYYGNHEEGSKHDEIIRIRDFIELRNAIQEIEEKYATIRYVELAVTNCGKSFDEDIEVAIYVPKRTTLLCQELPKLSDETISTIIGVLKVESLFGIQGTAEMDSYNSVRRDFLVTPPGIINHDDNDQYEKEMNHQFVYSVFPENDKLILKFGIPYLKHNSSVAFPTPLFITEAVDQIEYRITSKYSPEIVEGAIEIDHFA